MSDTSLVKKLQIKANQKMAIINPPPGYIEGLGQLPSGAKIVDESDAALDFAQLFVKSREELETLAPKVIKAVKSDGLLWICYPKGGSKVKTDLNRDILWKAMEKFGMAGVAMISIDSVWSAMRFRPSEKVGK